ncbi:hypothetical protein ABT294_47035 [Nonomuraea sp. NPDC000554]|uniref:hypothetical protein n=1 Tax=Nonomuraea sp. NPDC000554 TaxID=3154259 RepID=UPI00331F3BDC
MADMDADAVLRNCAYLVTAAPAEVLPLLGQARSREARLAAAVYRATLWQHRDASAEVRRQVLSLDAARLGDRECVRFGADHGGGAGLGD